MKFETRKAVMDDIDDLVEIEKSAMPNGGWYVYDDRFFFLEQQGNVGEMVLSFNEDGEPVGMGQYSVMPDGSGWLECLRVKKEWQHQGVGKSIYKRYMELAEETNAPTVAMFTGFKNLASKGLAEIHGFTHVATYDEMNLNLDGVEATMPEGFELVDDVDKIEELIGDHQGWGDFLVLNRTFMHYGRPLYEYLKKRNMVYFDGTNVVVLGCRKLEERGWEIGFFKGDKDTCLNFAIAKTKEKGLPALKINFPPEREDLREYFTGKGFEDSGQRIVMEWVRPE